jgi:type I restriction enzyme S subunit
MKSNYKKLGEFIKEINIRNTDLFITKLIGVSMEKTFISSVANVIGTDMSVYKKLKKGQFACKLMSVGRDEKLPVDLYRESEDAIVSSAYYVFESVDENIILSDYLFMWLCRPENDRYIGYISGGDVRGGISWETFCNIPIVVPSIITQKSLVTEYNIIENRIIQNKKLIQKLDETAQAIYKRWFIDEKNDNWIEKTLDDLCYLITDGKHGDCEDEINSGYYFISAKDLRDNTIIFNGARQITKKDFEETHRRTNLKPGDICMVNTGATIGRMSIAPDVKLTFSSTFQKSVAVIKPRLNVSTSCYLYSLLRSNIKEIKELGSGTSQENLLLGDLKKYTIKYPGIEKILEFENKIRSIFKMQYLKTIENFRLIQLKELFLSKLATLEN